MSIDRSTAPLPRPAGEGARVVLTIGHQEEVALGVVGPAAASQGVTLDVRRPAIGEPLPQDLSGYAGALVLGGAQSAYDSEELAYLRDEMDLIVAAHARGIPLLGICLGSQLMSQALGGEALPGAAGLECGYIEVRPEGPSGADLAGRFFSFHSDSFRPPPDAEILGRSADYVQSWRKETSLALQYHPDLDLDGIRHLFDIEEDKLRGFGWDVDALRAEAERAAPRAAQEGEALIAGWMATLAAPAP